MKCRRAPLLVFIVSVLLVSPGGETASATSSTGLGSATTTAAPTVAVSLDLAADATTTAANEDDDDCRDEIEYANNPELLDRLKKYDVAKVLEELGGGPGRVNATLAKDVPELDVAGEVAGDAPLPDTDNQTFWLYDYRSTDWNTYVRLEHALVRRQGQLDVRGEVWWTPTDVCGALRHAKYRLDERGFVAEVLRAHCQIFAKSGTLSCFGPDSENECASCISGVSGALIATLVG